MDVKVTNIHATAGRSRRVDVTVTLLKRPPRRISAEVTFPLKFVRNFTGWFQDVDGNWHTPWRLVDDEWQFYMDPEIQWATRELTQDEVLALLRPQIQEVVHEEVVAIFKDTPLTEYVDDEQRVRIVPKGPVHLSGETGWPEVEIEAFDSVTGEELWTHDGFWAIGNPPLIHQGVEDPAYAFKKALAMLVRSHQK